MVQRRKAVIKPEKSFASTSHHFHQETRNKGGGEVKKKKMMNLQLFGDASKESLPNYMKPTTCSGARKVTPVDVQGKASCSGSKPAKKNLVRKSSLKHVRVGSSVVCNPRKSVKRATCSSTQKDSKFPKALDLNPLGTSVVKVCPYNYCSLNGHRHEVLPPLKSFLESRRLAMKIEQRMKLKKEEKIDAGKKKVVKKNHPLVEELGDDFFVEIYAKELVSCDQIEVVFDDNGSDCGSESSICEMEGMMNLLEYVEFDQIVKDAEENELKCVVSEERGIEDAADSNDAFIPSQIVSVSHDVCEDVTDYDIFVSEQKGIEDAADSNDAFISSQIVIVSHDVCEDVADCDIVVSEQRGIEDAADSNNALITSEIVSVSHDVCEDVADYDIFVSEERGIEDAADSNGAFISSQIVIVSHDVCEDVADCDIVVSEQRGIEDAADSNDAFITSEIVSVTHDVCEDVADEETFDAEEEENLVGDSSIVEEEVISKDSDEKLAGESAQVSVTFEQLSETDESTITADSDQECFESSDDETDGDAELRKISSSNRARASDRSLTESLRDNPKLRLRITRKEKIREEQMMTREFNPKSPNFLPCQPEADNEKVDLKHQEMDDRKNAEEWMVDYALRQAVRKLSPASKRKVALLVKAFETVIPMRMQACS